MTGREEDFVNSETVTDRRESEEVRPLDLRL